MQFLLCSHCLPITQDWHKVSPIFEIEFSSFKKSKKVYRSHRQTVKLPEYQFKTGFCFWKCKRRYSFQFNEIWPINKDFYFPKDYSLGLLEIYLTLDKSIVSGYDLNLLFQQFFNCTCKCLWCLLLFSSCVYTGFFNSNLKLYMVLVSLFVVQSRFKF